MQLKERLQLGLPDLERMDAPIITTGLLLGAGIQAALAAQFGHLAPPVVVLGIPLSKLVFWCAELMQPDKLRAREIERHLNKYRKGREAVRKLRKACKPSKKKQKGLAAFGLNLLGRLAGAFKEDQQLLERIENLVDEIGAQFRMADPFVQRQLFSALPQVIHQATVAMQIGQRLTLLQNFIENSDITGLKNEEQELREFAEHYPTSPVGTLNAQTLRFKNKQIANILQAMQTTAVYRAQLRAMEAGLSNVQGRIATMIAVPHEDALLEMEALVAEMEALDEGIQMAAKAASGDYPFDFAAHAATSTASDSGRAAQHKNHLHQ